MLFNPKNKDCKVCMMKGELIDQLMQERTSTCRTCHSYDEQVKYLKDELEKLRQEWRSERDEYKRAVDRIMEVIGSRPIGQGALPSPSSLDMTEMEIKALGMFEDKELDEQGMKRE